MLPSIEALAGLLDLSESDARSVRDLMTGDADPLQWERAAAHNRQCYHAPSWQLSALYAIDEILGTYGIEGWCDEVGAAGVSYCNTGDAYAVTVCLVSDGWWSEFRVCSWGDIAEEQPPGGGE